MQNQLKSEKLLTKRLLEKLNQKKNETNKLKEQLNDYKETFSKRLNQYKTSHKQPLSEIMSFNSLIESEDNFKDNLVLSHINIDKWLEGAGKEVNEGDRVAT